MSKHFRPWNIDQTLLLPPNVQDFVPKDSLFRLIPPESNILEAVQFDPAGARLWQDISRAEGCASRS